MGRMRNVQKLRPGDKITVQILDSSLAPESVYGTAKYPYQWSRCFGIRCTVLADYPNFIVCERNSTRSPHGGMTAPYRVTFDKIDIQNGGIIIKKARRNDNDNGSGRDCKGVQ